MLWKGSVGLQWVREGKGGRKSQLRCHCWMWTPSTKSSLLSVGVSPQTTQTHILEGLLFAWLLIGNFSFFQEFEAWCIREELLPHISLIPMLSDFSSGRSVVLSLSLKVSGKLKVEWDLNVELSFQLPQLSPKKTSPSQRCFSAGYWSPQPSVDGGCPVQPLNSGPDAGPPSLCLRETFVLTQAHAERTSYSYLWLASWCETVILSRSSWRCLFFSRSTWSSAVNFSWQIKCATYSSF